MLILDVWLLHLWTSVMSVQALNSVKVISHQLSLLTLWKDLMSLNVKAIFFMNTVPQFEYFKSAPWNNYERNLIKWGQHDCGSGAAQSVHLFGFVFAIPSTFFVPSQMRYFGQSGFSAYKDDNDSMEMSPKRCGTAACCTFQNKDDGWAGHKKEYGLLEKLPCKNRETPIQRSKLNAIEERFTRKEITEDSLRSSV